MEVEVGVPGVALVRVLPLEKLSLKKVLAMDASGAEATSSANRTWRLRIFFMMICLLELLLLLSRLFGNYASKVKVQKHS